MIDVSTPLSEYLHHQTHLEANYFTILKKN